MSLCRQQAFIDAPPEIVWRLLSEIDRHQEWWPGFVEVECDGLENGCEYRQVVIDPFGKESGETFRVEQMEDCEELSIHCLDTGTFVRFVLTEAQGGTFVDGRPGWSRRASSTGSGMSSPASAGTGTGSRGRSSRSARSRPGSEGRRPRPPWACRS